MQSLDAPASWLSLSKTSSDIRFGDKNPSVLRTDIAIHWLRKEYSICVIITKLEQVATHSSAILFQLVYRSNISRCLFISVYQTAVGIVSPVEFAKEAFHLHQVTGKALPYRAASNYLYLFVPANSCILFILDFKHSFSYGAETELKCNTGITESLILAFYRIQTVGT